MTTKQCFSLENFKNCLDLYAHVYNYDFPFVWQYHMVGTNENIVAINNPIIVPTNRIHLHVTTGENTSSRNLKVVYNVIRVHTTTKRKVHTTQVIPCRKFLYTEPR